MGETANSGTAKAQSAQSALTSVVVHAAGAVCTRRAHVTVPAGNGEATVRIGGLPLTLHEQSLRAHVVTGPRGLRVTGIRLDLGATLRRGDELPGLRLDLEDAEDQQARLRERRERLEGEIEEVAGLRAEPPQPRRGDPPRWAPVESFLALAGFVDTRLGTLHEQVRITEDQLDRADHEVDVLRARLHEASSAVNTERAQLSLHAVVTLAPEITEAAEPAETADAAETAEPTKTSDAAGARGVDAPPGDPGLPEATTGSDPVEIEVEYHVPGATWIPTYQLRLDGSSGAGTLVLRASVAQRTGEDWTGVHLGLSTADLLRRADLPELRSIRIGRAQEEARAQSWREPPAGLAELFTGYDTATAARPAAPPQRPRSVAAEPAGSAFPADPIGGAPPEAAGYGGAAEDAVSPAMPAPGGGPVPYPAVLPLRPPAAAAPASPAPDLARRAIRAPQHPAAAAPDARSKPPGRSVTTPATSSAAPTADMLDYAGLTMTGPDAAAGRGTLRQDRAAADPVVAAYRRRAEAVGRLPRPAHAVDVRTSAGSFDYRFDTAAPADVASDGRWHIVPVSEVPVRTESVYVCVPSVDTAVFATVLVENTSGHALLAGPADVMVDGDFVLTAALPTLAPGQREAVGVGVAESVQVARRTHMRESSAGLRGGTTVLEHTVEVEAANRLPYPVVLEVRERVPVSTDKDVRIEVHKAQPAWAEPEEPPTGEDGAYVRGVRVWRVELTPGQATTLSGGFEIRLPAGKSVVGGNRRN
ncbi:DUF4139 domain-containing protein [Streptomyces sp. NBC_01476]|uniref:DUF4139 domain-containing protein n=1 Tax=Streptomyces sp. NBC_01476 TaxID=2903881 RepID=UPI002E307774|nr:DUF4139 domain-containing protein [Streptomyces sp. NBC_01476]